MNYPNALSGTTATLPTLVPTAPSEIERESIELDNAIQSVFEVSQELSKRLQPVLSQYPAVPQEQNKNPEEALSDLGEKLRTSRHSIHAIAATLREIISRLVL